MLTDHTNVTVKNKVCWWHNLLLDKGHFITADYIFSEEKEESRYKLVDKWIDQARLCEAI